MIRFSREAFSALVGRIQDPDASRGETPLVRLLSMVVNWTNAFGGSDACADITQSSSLPDGSFLVNIVNPEGRSKYQVGLVRNKDGTYSAHS